jgi:putative membrane protein
LYIHLLGHGSNGSGRDASFWLGLSFITLAVAVLIYSVVKYRRVLSTLRAAEIPARYTTWSGVVLNLAVAAIGVGVMVYLAGEI